MAVVRDLERLRSGLFPRLLVALLGRAATASEVQAFEWVYRRAPARVPIVLGSRNTPGESPALAVLVPADNPLRHIDFAQLRGLLEPRPPAGVPRVLTWGQLGLRGRWAAHRVDVYMANTESGTGRFFRDTVLGGSGLLAWAQVSEFGGRSGPKPGESEIVRALRLDPFGLAITAVPRGTQPVVVLAVAAKRGGPYEQPSAANLSRDRYPLERTGYAYFRYAGGSRLARRFIRYIRSRRGQAAIPGNGYLPLPAPARHEHAAPVQH